MQTHDRARAGRLAGRRPSRRAPLLLDVRENWEFETCHIAGSTQIPMHRSRSRIGELDDDSRVVCICHHGARSMQVAAFLERNGFDRSNEFDGRRTRLGRAGRQRRCRSIELLSCVLNF
jgi:rhodanese-related sulfurtransferase